MSEERLRRELLDAFTNRAHLYRLLLDELGMALGDEAAERLLATIIERRGREVGAALAHLPDARAVGEAFLAASPDGGRLYPTDVEPLPDGIRFAVCRCPLQDAWRVSGLASTAIARLCRLAGAFDKGLFEAAGCRFANTTWREGQAGCCRIELRDR